MAQSLPQVSFWGLLFGIVWQDYHGQFVFSYFLPPSSLFQDQMQLFCCVAQNTQFIRGCVDFVCLKYVGVEQISSGNELRS